MADIEKIVIPHVKEGHKENYNAAIQELKEKTKEMEEKLDILSHLLLDEIEADEKPKKVPERMEYNPDRCFWEGVVPLIVLITTFTLMGIQSVGEKVVETKPEYPANFAGFRR